MQKDGVMMSIALHAKKPQHNKKVRQIVMREGAALLVLMSMLSGTCALYWATSAILPIPNPNLILILIAGSMANLPKVFSKIRSSQEPYIIRFALGFREGFFPVLTKIPNLLTAFQNMLLQLKESDNQDDPTTKESHLGHSKM